MARTQFPQIDVIYATGRGELEWPAEESAARQCPDRNVHLQDNAGHRRQGPKALSG